jgi:hypothetical protein
MAETKTTTLHHPTFADTAAEVPAADVDAWVEQGWRKTKPKTDSE